MMQTFVRIENNHIAEPLADNQRFCRREELPEGEDWRPLIVENPIYDRMKFRRNDATTTYVIHPDRVVRSHGLDPIAVTVDMIKAECQRRIIAHCGAHDLTGALVKQMNNPGLKTGIDVLRAKSNVLEAMSPIPDDYRSDHYWS